MGSKIKSKPKSSFKGSASIDNPPPPPKATFLRMFIKTKGNTEETPKKTFSKRANAPKKSQSSLMRRVKLDHDRIEAEQRKLMQEAEEKWKKREAHEQQVRNALHRHIKQSVELGQIQSQKQLQQHAKMHYHLTRRAYKEKVHKLKSYEKHRRQQLEEENVVLKKELKNVKQQNFGTQDIIDHMANDQQIMLTIPPPPKPLGEKGVFEFNTPQISHNKKSWFASLFSRREVTPLLLNDVDDALPKQKIGTLPVLAPLLLESHPKHLDFLVPSHVQTKNRLHHLRSKEGKLKQKWSKKKMLYEQDRDLHSISVKHKDKIKVEVPQITDVPAIDWMKSTPQSEQEIKDALQSVTTSPNSAVGKVERWINQVEQAVQMHNAQDAKNAYVQAMKVYLSLPQNDQEKVYARLQSVYQRRQSISV